MCRWWIPVLWIVLPGIVVGADPSVRIQKGFHEAAALLETRSWEKARGAYRELLSEGDEFFRPHASLGLARACVQLRAFDEAVAVLREIPAQVSGRPLEERELWQSAATIETGRVLMAQGRVEAALATMQEAIQGWSQPGKDPTWRARAEWKVARSLSATGRRAEAIELLTRGLARLEGSPFGGVRAYHAALLARTYFEVGERDWAVTLLERIRADRHLDDDQFAVAEAMVEDRKWRPKEVGRLRTRQRTDHLVVESPGRFELRIGIRKKAGGYVLANPGGAITAWFNLEEDPFKTTNLVGGTGRALIEIAGRPPGEEMIAGPVGFELLEKNPTRVRIRCTRRAWPWEETTYTIHATGQVFMGIRFERAPEKPPGRIGKVSFRTSVAPGMEWSQEAVDAGTGETPRSGHYLLARGSVLPMPDRTVSGTFVLMPSRPGASKLETARVGAFSSSQSMVHLETGGGGGGALALQFRVAPKIADPRRWAGDALHDYQSPASLSVGRDAMVRDDPGDWDGDGFNESEGCHVVRGRRRVSLGVGGRMRAEPVIKFLDPPVDGIPDVHLNGMPADRSLYNLSWLDSSAMILHWKGTVPPGKEFELFLR